MEDQSLELIPVDQWPREAIYARAMIDRKWFVENCFDHPEPGKGQTRGAEIWQNDVMGAMDAGETRISVRSGHGVGKTTFASWISIHMILFTLDTKIIVTSPSSSQLRDGLIPETKLWIKRLKYGLATLIAMSQSRITRAEDPDNNFISFRTARLENPEALQGVHATNVLVIADEASGVPEPVYEAARGTMSTAGATFILIGNPTKAKGMFFRTHTMLKDLWWTRRVSCLESSRVDGAFVEEMRRTYGEQSNQWRIRVLGEFPENDDDSVIPRGLAAPALERDVEIGDDEPIWGLDPGRGGDPTGFVERVGRVVTEAQELYYPDTMQVVGWVFDKWQNVTRKPSMIAVDSIGIGAGVADRLREMGLPVMDVNVSEAPALRDKYPRLRAELWFTCRAWFERRDVRIDLDPALGAKLVDELVEPSFLITGTGKSDVETKKQMKSRGVASPNLADALCMTFAGDGGIASGAAGSSSGWGKAAPWNKPLTKSLRLRVDA